MRVLVTGGLGFVGSALSKGLRDAGHDVRIFDDASRGRRANLAELALDLPVISGDIRDASAVRDACEGVDAIAHLAAVQGTGSFYRMPETVLDVNVTGVLNVARACAGASVGRLLFASSSEVYATPARFPTPEDEPLIVPDPLNPRFSYSASKIVGELIVINFARRQGFEYTIVRYHNVYGPRMGWDHVIPQFIARLERGEEFTVQGDGRQTRAFCYVDDAVDATVRALTRPEGANAIFNVGNPEREWSINDLVSFICRVSGRRIDPTYVGAAEGSTLRRVPDISRARERLGFVPRVGLEEGLALTYRWYSAAIRAEREAERAVRG